nr:hypothetical protein [Tanacetum cinerariifolium]
MGTLSWQWECIVHFIPNKSKKEMQTPGSGISILLAVGTPFTRSGNLYCQWKLSPGSGNALCILFPTNNSMVEEVTYLKKDFKHKENKYLEEYLDMNALKEKVKDKLFKQDHYLQTVHMLCKPKPYYDEHRKVVIGYKSPLCLTHAKQVQPVLYTGHEIIKTDHVPAIVHNSEDTLEIAEITRKKMNQKMKTPLLTHNKINIRPLDYSKENFLATFTPQTQLSPKQIFWSKDVLKLKTKALKEQGKATKPVKALTVYPPNTPVKLIPKETHSEADRTLDFRALDFQITQLTKKVSVLQEQSNLFRVENAKVKQHYKELYDSIKITCAKHIDQTTALLTENGNLKVQINAKLKCVTIDSVTPKVLASGMYVIDVEPIPPRLRNNKEVHLDYLKHLKESVETFREIVEEAKVERPLDISLASAFLYTKHSQELLEYVIGTCSKDYNKRDKKQATTPLTRKKQVTFVDQCETSNNNTHKHIEQQTTQKTYVLMIPSTVFIETVRFGNDHFGAIMRQFCDSDLEVAFRKRSCYVRDTDGIELIKGSRGSNFYTISVEDMMKSSLICLLSKASKTKSWLWHRRLNHLNFGTINDLARKDLVRGLPRLKFKKDHLCSVCQLGNSKKHTHSPKTKNTNLEVLNTIHMDLCGPMRGQTINGKKYILVIIDDYTQFTWVKFLRSKDETPKVVIKFLKQIQVGFNKTVRFIHTDSGTEFFNHDLTNYYESVSIFHQKSVPRTPQLNGVVER